MTGFEICIVALLVGALGPAVALASSGRPTNRLVGLELCSAVLVVLFVLFTKVSGYTFDLILPLVLVPLSFAGALVYTRLLSAPKAGQGERE